MNPAKLAAEQRLRLTTELRSVARRFGLIPYLSRARSMLERLAGRGQHYEARFDEALLRAIRAGDVVWDVGANVGLYTTRFSDAVGSTGTVVAFEPTPACFAALQRATHGRANVRTLQKALGDKSSIASMTIAHDPLGATHSLVIQSGGETAQVEVARGDDLVASGEIPTPNVLKVDVEGFEEEVLEGLRDVLSSSSCRALLCEVHFGILDQRGRRQAPMRISDLLEQNGYRVEWVDASHLAATR